MEALGWCGLPARGSMEALDSRSSMEALGWCGLAARRSMEALAWCGLAARSSGSGSGKFRCRRGSRKSRIIAGLGV